MIRSFLDWKFSVVADYWSAEEFLRTCIRPFQRKASAFGEIVVIDHFGSDDPTELAGVDCPHVNLIEIVEDQGCPATENQGGEIAGSRYVFLFNHNTITLEDAIDGMIRLIAAKLDIGCAGWLVREDDNTIRMTCFADRKPANLAMVVLGLVLRVKWLPIPGRSWWVWTSRSVPEYGSRVLRCAIGSWAGNW